MYYCGNPLFLDQCSSFKSIPWTPHLSARYLENFAYKLIATYHKPQQKSGQTTISRCLNMYICTYMIQYFCELLFIVMCAVNWKMVNKMQSARFVIIAKNASSAVLQGTSFHCMPFHAQCCVYATLTCISISATTELFCGLFF